MNIEDEKIRVSTRTYRLICNFLSKRKKYFISKNSNIKKLW